eukprot:8261626-Pyramimonas_sp.AAC.1
MDRGVLYWRSCLNARHGVVSSESESDSSVRTSIKKGLPIMACKGVPGRRLAAGFAIQIL